MQPLTWSALEYERMERNSDWFWTLGILALGGAILAIIFDNVLFALFIIIGAVTLGLHALRHPRAVTFQITSKGIVIDETLFPYATLESYDIHEHHYFAARLVVKSQKLVMPYLFIPLSHDVDADDVRIALAGKLPETEIPLSLAEKIMGLFGF